MKTTTLFAPTLLFTAVFFSACEKKNDPDAPVVKANPSTSTPAPKPAPAADNTERNKVDRDPASTTPMDQGMNAADTKITADIRRAIMDDKLMSMNAQNCKIVTEKGVVTLRGPVDTQAEKDAIDAKAKAVASVVRVDNMLEVKNP